MPFRLAVVAAASLFLATSPNVAQTTGIPTLEEARELLEQGRHAQAEALLREIVERDATDGAARAELGRTLALSERHPSAIEQLEMAIELGHRDLATLFYLGSSLWEVGEVVRSREAFEEALRRFGRRPVVLAQLGRLLAWSGRHDEAVPLLQEAARLTPRDSLVLMDLGRALDGAGETERALETYRRAVQAAPEHAEIRYVFARLLRKVGAEEEANRELAAYRVLYEREQERTRSLGLERAALLGGSSLGPKADDIWDEGDTECDLRLQDVATAIGLDFVHDRGSSPENHLPETMGAGLSWIDFDGDGWLDLYVVQSGPIARSAAGSDRSPDRLFRNRGDGTFEDRTEAVGTSRTGAGQGSVAGDLDGDGDTDLYLTNYGPDVVLVNDGRGRFTDGTEAAGLEVDGWSSSAALADGDGDGDLDVYVSRYVEYDSARAPFCGDRESGLRRYCDPSLFFGAADRYLENDGNGRFTDASRAAGIEPAAGRGLGVIFTDLDGDRDPDVYVANDLTLNFLFANRGDGRFDDLTLLSGAAVNREGRPEAGMGIALADVDGDLDGDLAVTNFDIETNSLYLHGDVLDYEEVAARSGFGTPSFNRLAFGIAAADLDHDGVVDFYLANGHIFEQPKRENVTYAQRDQVLLGDGEGGFTEARCAGFLPEPTVARGLASADYDRDGDIDLAVQGNGGRLGTLRNDGSAELWLGVSAPGVGGVGARVTLETDRGDHRRWVLAGDSYQSSGDPAVVAHARPAAKLEALLVEWRQGGAVRFRNPPRNSYLVLASPAGAPRAGIEPAPSQLE